MVQLSGFNVDDICVSNMAISSEGRTDNPALILNSTHHDERIRDILRWLLCQWSKFTLQRVALLAAAHSDGNVDPLLSCKRNFNLGVQEPCAAYLCDAGQRIRYHPDASWG